MGHRSPFPDVHVPAVPITDYIFEHADSYPDKCAIVDAASGKTLRMAISVGSCVVWRLAWQRRVSARATCWRSIPPYH